MRLGEAVGQAAPFSEMANSGVRDLARRAAAGSSPASWRPRTTARRVEGRGCNRRVAFLSVTDLDSA
jgi:hypothetical protein